MSNEAVEMRKKEFSGCVCASLLQTVTKNNKFKLKKKIWLFLLSVAFV